MKSLSYVIDPDGDIELVLNKPNTQNIMPIDLFYRDSVDISRPPFSENSVLEGRYTVFDNFDTRTLDEEYNTFKFLEETPDVVRMRVSSKHLTFASKVFRAMLEGPWAEATTSLSSQTNPRQISTSAWDAKALAIVLDVIHGRFHRIPREINLVLLARIATIVDYYQCYESMGLASKFWLSQPSITEQNIDIYTYPCLLLLYVAWVFESHFLFTTAAQRVLKDGKGPSEFDLKDLPVGGVLDVLNDKRTELIGRVVEGLDMLQETLRTETECPRMSMSDCSSTLLGILMRERFRWEEQYDPLEPPYDRYNTLTLRAMVDGFPLPKASLPNYNNSRINSSGELDLYHLQCTCTIQERMQKLMEEINNDIGRFRPWHIRGWGSRHKENC